MSLALSNSFNSAVSYLSNSTSHNNVSNNVKLELYALFKCITVSNRPQTSRPSIFDFTGRAKWDAWDELGRESEDVHRDVLRRRYLEIAETLGWNKDGTHENEEMKPAQREGGVGGMGASVSVMAKLSADEEEEGLHSFAVRGDVQKLTEYLKIYPRAELDKRDAHGYTALHLGADRGHEGVVRLLLEHGANPTLKDPDEFTALELSEIAGHEIVAALLSSNRNT